MSLTEFSPTKHSHAVSTQMKKPSITPPRALLALSCTLYFPPQGNHYPVFQKCRFRFGCFCKLKKTRPQMMGTLMCLALNQHRVWEVTHTVVCSHSSFPSPYNIPWCDRTMIHWPIWVQWIVNSRHYVLFICMSPALHTCQHNGLCINRWENSRSTFPLYCCMITRYQIF